MFLVCGEALFDMFGDVAGEYEDGAILFRAVAGGSPYNVAIGLARLGRKVALSTQLFDDQLGRRLEKTLSSEGIDLAFIRRNSGATPLALVQLDRAGAPHYAFHGLEELRVHPAGFASDDPSWSGVHVGSIPIVSKHSSEPLLKLLSVAKERLISFDPNVRLSFEPDTLLWARQIGRFRRHAHLIKVSVEDVESIHGDGVDPERLAASWLQHETQIVILTRGVAGSVLFSRQCAPITIPAVATDFVDAVGAGDSFMAALLCWLDEAGYARRDALRMLDAEQLRSMAGFASLASAHTCSHRGPNLPYRSVLEDCSLSGATNNLV